MSATNGCPLLIKNYFPSVSLRFEKVKTILNAKRNEKILDVGSGLGLLDMELAPNAGMVVGIDIKKDFVVAAKGLSRRENEFFVIGDAENLPFKRHVFDKIFSSEVIEHLEKPGKFLTGIYNIVKKGGSVLITTPNGNTNILSKRIPLPLPSLILGKITKNQKLLYPYGHMHDCFSKKGLVEMMERNRFKIETINYCGSVLTKIFDDIIYAISVACKSGDEVMMIRKKSLILQIYMKIFPVIRYFTKMDSMLLKLKAEGYITIIQALRDDTNA